MRVSLRSPAQPSSMTFDRFARSQLNTSATPKSNIESPARAAREQYETSEIPGLLTPTGSFELHRFLILALAHNAAERTEAPATGAAILMRVVYPPVAAGNAGGAEHEDFQDSDAPVSGWPPLDASFDPHVAVLLVARARQSEHAATHQHQPFGITHPEWALWSLLQTENHNMNENAHGVPAGQLNAHLGDELVMRVGIPHKGGALAFHAFNQGHPAMVSANAFGSSKRAAFAFPETTNLSELDFAMDSAGFTS